MIQELQDKVNNIQQWRETVNDVLEPTGSPSMVQQLEFGMATATKLTEVQKHTATSVQLSNSPT